MVTVQPERILLADVLTTLGVTREELINIAILTGTDFHPGIKGIGAKTGLKKIKSGEFESIIREKVPDFDPEPIRKIFLDPPVTDAYSLKTTPIDPDKIMAFLCEEHGFSSERVEPVLEKISKKEKQKTLDGWF
jgi:flap endonuclease-1